MQLKVCGLNERNSTELLRQISPDYVGAIHYKKSSRHLELEEIKNFFEQIDFAEKVLVTVNLPLQKMMEMIDFLKPDLIQLHGSETNEYLNQLIPYVKIIKAFKVSPGFNFDETKNYSNAHYFLFDTKGKKMGGNGIKFNWDLLQNYKSNKPFFLSGGISMTDVERINSIEHPQLFGVDINSRFERSPGIKDVIMINEFKKRLK